MQSNLATRSGAGGTRCGTDRTADKLSGEYYSGCQFAQNYINNMLGTDSFSFKKPKALRKVYSAQILVEIQVDSYRCPTQRFRI